MARTGPGLRIAIGVLVAVVAVGLPFQASGFQSLELAYALTFAIAILGLNLLIGYSGQISLGHGAFLAVGGYVTAIGQQRYGLNYLVTIPLAGIISGLIGFLVGLPALRLHGIYLALATFALAVAAPSVMKKPADLTGGVKGIILPPYTSLVPGLSDDQYFYFLCLLITVILFLVSYNILRKRPGRAFKAVRDGELAAAAFGINVSTYKTLAFAISAIYGGVAGSLYATATGFVSPDSYPFQLSILLLVGAVLGGIATIEGAIFGGLFTEFLPIFSQQALTPISRQLANAAPAVTQGIVLLIVMFVARQGIAGLLRQGYAALRGRLRTDAQTLKPAGESPPTGIR
ncbi:MAG: branched-chain amino acid ABC transporter permease [Candidatus Dormibacteraeota bacterium]|uniref:Branched-chain amino acid ABC transporter permease n=1 Tax=Candidatus Dormiibacter inghamiae TaxID=3127013 RepID=A0A934KGC1_9BACT|nr:branched-chain amino acid ABC transporter permease [Candidatus Dormibacteraeota bacterium]MBJ7606925.1 branched-chain amino acid ABC transporter permease [Candidatus Dormibacteraeota bacterium]